MKSLSVHISVDPQTITIDCTGGEAVTLPSEGATEASLLKAISDAVAACDGFKRCVAALVVKPAE